jgi:carbon storage regulator CsrA
MLVLSRKSRESVVVSGDDGIRRLLKVTVLGIQGESVKLGFEVDADASVRRGKVGKRIRANDRRDSAADVSAALMQFLESVTAPSPEVA